MVLLFAVNLVFIFNIELTLRDNGHLRTRGESNWTFGQILAILLLVLPLRDLRVFGVRRDFTTSLQSAVQWQGPTDLLRDLVRRGANVNVKAKGDITIFTMLHAYSKFTVAGSRYPTVLLLAVSERRDPEFTQMLLVYGADPNIKGENLHYTPLQAAASHADLQIVRLLLAYGADPNLEGGEYGTALQAAAHSGDLQITQMLLEKGAEVNMHGGKYGTAVQAASSNGHTEVIELLRTHGATS
ncbi:ankyrin repeat-containing domain protein [Mycena amicta]|nr:ankyrin repeat-containing domain protein [Mycena amicta]KAJ7050846.1 ankyrin repeat-containing domain protein [Mycena amicta]